MKSLPKLIAECQAVFNDYVRLRDIAGCDYFKCISCGQIKSVKYCQAGHYYNVGHYPGLRFDEDNAHSQCTHCNLFLHGNLIDYGHNLIFKIGMKRYEELKTKADYYKRVGKKFSRFEVEEKIKELKEKIKNYENM